MFESYMITLTDYSNKYTFINYLEKQNIMHKVLDSVQMFLVNATQSQIRNIIQLKYIATVAKDELVPIHLEPTNNTSKINDTNMKKSTRKFKFDPDETEILNWGIEEMNASCLWKIGVTGKGIKVAVIDSGVGPRQGIDVAQYVTFTQGTPNDINGHGTSVASLIKGLEDFGFETGIFGVAYDCELYSLKVAQGDELQNNEKFIFPLIEAINWCIENKIRVANISIGVRKEVVSNAVYQLLNEAIKKALNAGVILVTISGNRGSEIDTVPGIMEGLIVIGSINKEEERSSFSSYGPTLDFVAAGEDVETMSINNSIKIVNGTSFAAPQVTGLIALILSQNPLLTPKEVKDILIKSAKDILPQGYDIYTGYGAVKAPISKPKRLVNTNQITYQSGQAGNIEFKAQDDERSVAYLDVDVTIEYPDYSMMNKRLVTNTEGIVNIPFVTDKDDQKEGEIVLNQMGNYSIRGTFIGNCCNCTGSQQPSTNINVVLNTLHACIKRIYKTCNFNGYCIEVEVKNGQNSPVENTIAKLIGFNCKEYVNIDTKNTNKSGIVTLYISQCTYFSYKSLCIKLRKEGYKEAIIKCIEKAIYY